MHNPRFAVRFFRLATRNFHRHAHGRFNGHAHLQRRRGHEIKSPAGNIQGFCEMIGLVGCEPNRAEAQRYAQWKALEMAAFGRWHCVSTQKPGGTTAACVWTGTHSVTGRGNRSSTGVSGETSATWVKASERPFWQRVVQIVPCVKRTDLPYTLAMSTPQTASTSITWQSIVEAHDRIRSRIHRTPVLTSRSLNSLTGAQLFFKCENLQKTGSFKIRGAANAILSLSDSEAAQGIVTLSSGNHGAAVACAAAWRGVPAWIVMPRDSPKVKCRAVESYGGKVIYCEPTISARKEVAARVQAETGAVLVHPYDDDRIMAGQATAGKEFLEDVPDLDFLITPVSGGGLLSGTCLSAKHMRPAIKVFGGEPERADDAYRSMQTGILQAHDASDTIADGLRACLAPRTFAVLRKYLDGVLLVSEDEIRAAMHLIWQRMKIVVEPSSAVALAPVLRREGPAWHGKIGIILSGGNVELA